MNTTTQINFLQPPNQLADGFLNFATEINQKCIERGVKFSTEEIADFFNNSFPGKIRANFLLWLGDINKVIEAINLILDDLSKLRLDINSFDGNPITRTEFLFQAFFGEFFRIREISKSFIKYLSVEKIFNKKQKETFISFYFEAFEWVYELRNDFVHKGMTFKNHDVHFDISLLKNISQEEKEKFDALIKLSNTRENTIEIQCAYYMSIISKIMETYINFQELLNDVFADLILSFEELNLNITFSKNE